MSKASTSYVEVVISMGQHCENNTSTVLKVILAYEGVKSAKVDKESNTITITGDVDPEKIRGLLQKKTKKKVVLVSCPSKDKQEASEVIQVGCLCKKIACDTKGCDKQKLIVEVEGKAEGKKKKGGGDSGGKVATAEKKPEFGHEAVVAHGNGIVARHFHLHVNNLQIVFHDNGN